jgi:hypothetical protein
VHHYAANGLGQFSAQSAAHVSELIEWLDVAIASLQTVRPPRDGRPDPRTADQRIEQCAASQRAIQVAVLTHAALSVFYGDDSEVMARYARTILGSRQHFQFDIAGCCVLIEKIPVFSLALVDSLLKHSKGWRDATDPVLASPPAAVPYGSI